MLLQKICNILDSKWCIFMDFLVQNFSFFSVTKTVYSIYSIYTVYQYNTWKVWTSMEVDLHAINSIIYSLFLFTLTCASQKLE